MSYTANDGNLPDYIKKLPSEMRIAWVKIFNTMYQKYGEQMAFIVANKWLKRQDAKMRGRLVARSKSHKITFAVDKTDGYIKRDADGNDYITLVLTDEQSDPAIKYSPELLKRWADDINNGNYIVGDFDHKEYDFIMATTADSSQVEKKLREKRGIAKAIKAVFEKGKLWVKAMIDKRYKRKLQDIGVSLEAYIPEEHVKEGVATQGSLFGFSFIPLGKQGNPVARVAA